MSESTDVRLQAISLLMVRVVLGVIMLYYGTQNLFGLMGGAGFYASSQDFASGFQAELYVGQIAMIAQFAAGILLIGGLLSRYAATILAALMFVAAMKGVYATHSLVRTTGDDPLSAVAYPTCILVMSFVIVLMGGGQFSLDSRMKSKRRKAKVAQLS